MNTPRLLAPLSFALLCVASRALAVGSTWNLVYPAGVSNVSLVSFADAQVGVVGGSGGKAMFGIGQDVSPISYTADGGKTWANAWIDQPTIKYTRSLQMLTPTVGYGLGNDDKAACYLLKTTDGGKTWHSTLLSEQVGVSRVWFADENHGLFFAPSGRPGGSVASTADGGQTRQPIDETPFLPAPGWRPALLVPISLKDFWLIGNFDWLLHTTDGGASFQKAQITWEGPRDYLNLGGASVAPDGKTIYLVGGIASDYTENWRPPKQAVILRSPDAGQTWQRRDPPGVVNNLLCVQALSATEAWAGGFGGYGLTPWVPGVLLHTVDGGKTWKNESPSQVSVRGLFALDKSTLWAVGGQGGSPYEAAGVVLCYAPEAEGARPAGFLPIKYTMPADGYASLVLKDDQNRQVRTLLAHARRAAGKQTDNWDGLDDDGLPVAPGKYTWKLLTHQGITATYAASYNCPNDPTWATGDGQGGWAGDHGAPTSVCAVGDRMVLGFGAGEAQPAQIVVNLEGHKTGISGKGWSLALATDGTNVYALDEGFADYKKKDDPHAPVTTTVTRWEAATGHFAYLPGANREASRQIADWTLDQTQPEPFLSQRLAPGADPRLLGPDFSGHTVNNVHLRTTNACGLACGGGRVYVSLRLDNKILVLDSDLKPLGEIPVPAPVGLAFRDGALYAVSGTTVRKYTGLDDPATAQGADLVTGLTAPFSLAVDAQGNLAVGDWGASMQVKLFSPAGQLLRAIGKPGGRPWLGQYDPTGLLKPRGLAFDARGRLWVAEDDEPLKRISLWNPDGTLAKDLIGAGRYACFSWMYPDDPHTAYDNVYGVTRFSIDVVKRAWAPQAVLYRDGWDPKRIGPMLPFFRAKAPNGQEVYLTDTRSYTLGLAEMRGGLLYPLMACGWAPVIIPPDLDQGWNQPFNPIERKQRTDYKRHGAWYDEHGGEVCLWVDRNRDGLYQQDELTFLKLPGWDDSGWSHNPPAFQSWGEWITPDLTLYLTTAWTPGQVWRWPLAGWDATGPIYKPEDLKLVLTIPTHGTGAITIAPDGTIVSQDRLEGYSPAGKWLWRYPYHWPGFAFQAPFGKPGLVVGSLAFCGWVDDLFMVNGYFGQFNVLTADGLYVAQFLPDGRVGGALTAETIGAENFSGLFLRDQQSKRVYLIFGGGVDSRVFEIKGLDTLKRQNGDLAVSAADVEKARRAAAARVKPPVAEGPKEAYIRKVDQPLSIGGDLDDAWRALPPVAEVTDSPQIGYTVRAAHDGKFLYLAYDVRDGSPMVNNGDDFRMLFKTGDAVDLMLGPAGDRKQPVAGDLRLLLSVMAGKPEAVLYRPRALPGQPSAPASFASPNRAVPMERVTEEPGVEVSVVRRADSYLLKAKVPFETLGLQYTPGLTARGDFGVIYSDQEGSRDVFRSYWANRDPSIAIVNDVPSEAALTPAGWGKVTFQ